MGSLVIFVFWEIRLYEVVGSLAACQTHANAVLIVNI